MKKLTLIELTLLVVITFLTFWVGASTWRMVSNKTSAQKSIARTRNNVTERPAAPESAKARHQQQAPLAISRSVADQNPYVAELRLHPMLALLADNKGVKKFLDLGGQDFSTVVAKASQSKQLKFAQAASLLIKKVTKCLSEPSICQVTDLGTSYSVDKQTPLQTILYRSLDYVREAESNGPKIRQVTNADVLKAISLKPNQNNVQIYAIELLADRAANRDSSDRDVLNAIGTVSKIYGAAKVAFYYQFGHVTEERLKQIKSEYSQSVATRAAYLSALNVREQYLKALQLTLLDNNQNHIDGTMQVYANLAHFGLTPVEFQNAAKNACKIDLNFQDDNSRKRFFRSIENSASPQGYEIDFEDLCSTAPASAAPAGAVGG